MSYDRTEAQRRGQANRRTSKGRHPYAALEHRALDSPAFADLKPSAVLLLVLLARQDNGRNNGHLQATYAWCRRYGIGSEHTLRDAIADLIAHGFIYRTRSHGANKVWATYALTDRPIPDKTGLHLDGWQQLAWRDWQPSEKKAPGEKCRKPPAESAVSPSDFRQKVQESGGQKLQSMNLLPCSGGLDAVPPDRNTTDEKPGDWIPDYLKQLHSHGLADACPVAIH